MLTFCCHLWGCKLWGCVLFFIASFFICVVWSKDHLVHLKLCINYRHRRTKYACMLVVFDFFTIAAQWGIFHWKGMLQSKTNIRRILLFLSVKEFTTTKLFKYVLSVIYSSSVFFRAIFNEILFIRLNFHWNLLIQASFLRNLTYPNKFSLKNCLSKYVF